MVEQAIWRGNTVILHLEENPEAPELQAELAEMVFMVVHRVRGQYWNSTTTLSFPLCDAPKT